MFGKREIITQPPLDFVRQLAYILNDKYKSTSWLSNISSHFKSCYVWSRSRVNPVAVILKDITNRDGKKNDQVYRTKPFTINTTIAVSSALVLTISFGIFTFFIGNNNSSLLTLATLVCVLYSMLATGVSFLSSISLSCFALFRRDRRRQSDLYEY